MSVWVEITPRFISAISAEIKASIANAILWFEK